MTKIKNKNIGVKDIAKAAGVSTGTVDRVLHNRGEVKKETREKIKAIINKLGYKPNLLARSLASKKTTRIAIVIPNSSDNNPYWEKPVKGIRKAADELSNFNIEIIYKYFDASSESSYKNLLIKVCAENPDGVVLNPVFKSTTLHFINIFNTHNIPYVFIDINIKGVGKLCYFGQDAEQSGIVAAKLMQNSVAANSKIIIVKLSKGKVFSQHIESRVEGFLKSFEAPLNKNEVSINTIEIDLQNGDEPTQTLTKVFNAYENFDGIFVPNSRVFKVADFLEKNQKNNIVTIGYDLVERNVEYLKQGTISYLIGQKPEEQAYKAIMSLFDYLITKKEVEKTNYSPIDIIIKENIDYYNVTK